MELTDSDYATFAFKFVSSVFFSKRSLGYVEIDTRDTLVMSVEKELVYSIHS